MVRKTRRRDLAEEMMREIKRRLSSRGYSPSVEELKQRFPGVSKGELYIVFRKLVEEGRLPEAVIGKTLEKREVPLSINDLALLTAAQEFRAKYGRKPTIEEAAEMVELHTKRSLKRYRRVLEEKLGKETFSQIFSLQKKGRVPPKTRLAARDEEHEKELFEELYRD